MNNNNSISANSNLSSNNIGNTNIRYTQDIPKETSKALIVESNSNTKNISSLLNETVDKQAVKLMDSPPKKMLEPLNHTYGHNNREAVKIFSNNTTLSTSITSSSPLDKVHLTSLGLNNLGNTCYM